MKNNALFKTFAASLCFVLSASTVCASSADQTGADIPTYAESVLPDAGFDDEDFSLNIHVESDGETVSGVGVEIYKVADITYEDGAVQYDSSLEGFEFYSMTTADAIDAAEEIYSGSELSDMDSLGSSTGTNGTAYFTGIEAGVYLVAQSDAEEDECSFDPYLVWVPQSEEENGTYSWDYSVDSYPKTLDEEETARGNITIRQYSVDEDGEIDRSIEDEHEIRIVFTGLDYGDTITTSGGTVVASASPSVKSSSILTAFGAVSAASASSTLTAGRNGRITAEYVIANGEKVIFYNVPEGVEYTVYEEGNDDEYLSYKIVDRNHSGDIVREEDEADDAGDSLSTATETVDEGEDVVVTFYCYDESDDDEEDDDDDDDDDDDVSYVFSGLPWIGNGSSGNGNGSGNGTGALSGFLGAGSSATGDSSHMILWIAALAAGIAVAAGAIIYLKRKRRTADGE